MRVERWFYTLPLRLRSLFRRPKIDEELDEELRYHLERQIQDQIAKGLTLEEARTVALRAFGGLERRKEECRDMRRMNVVEDLWKDLGHAMRMLRRSPGFTTVAVLTLALGIGANTAVFSLIYPLTIAPLTFEDPDRLVRIFTRNQRSGEDQRLLSWVDYEEVRRQVKGLTEVAAFRSRSVNLSGPVEPVRVRAAEVTGSFFPLLRVEAARGRVFGEEERRLARRVAVISHGLQQRFFGSGDAVDRTVVLDGLPYDVIGVVAPGLRLPSPDPDVWIPLQLTVEDRDSGRFALGAVGRLASGATQEQVDEELAILASGLAANYPRTHEGWASATISLREALFGEFRTPVTLLLLAVLFVHLIAVSNVAILSFIRATTRAHELALRSALGAARLDLLRLFLAEGLVLCLLTGAVGLLVGWLGTRVLVLMLPPNIPQLENVTLNRGVLAFTLLLALVTTVICALAPLALVRRPNLVSLVNEQGRSGQGGRRRRRIQWSLVGSEVALACVLLAHCLVLIRSFEHLRHTEPGFDEERLLPFRFPRARIPQQRPASSGCQCFTSN